MTSIRIAIAQVPLGRDFDWQIIAERATIWAIHEWFLLKKRVVNNLLILSAIALFAALHHLWKVFLGKQDLMEPNESGNPWNNPNLFKSYVFGLLIFSGFMFVEGNQHERFEARLKNIAIDMAGKQLTLECRSRLYFWESASLVWAYADIDNNHIAIQSPACSKLKDFVEAPSKASNELYVGVHVLTHEIMHIKGLRDEAETDCAALQRNYQTAGKLGAPDSVAKKASLYYWKIEYPQRAQIENAGAKYFSGECRKGGALDEKLPSAPWDLKD